MPTLHPTTNLDLNYTNGQSWDYNQEMQIIGDLLITVVDFVQTSQPSTPSNGTAWASTSNGTYNVFVNNVWRQYNGDGLLLVGRGSLVNNIYKKSGTTWNFIVNNASLANAILTSATSTGGNFTTPTITTPTVTNGTFATPAITGGTITNATLTSTQNATIALAKQTNLSYWKSYHNYGGVPSMSAGESYLKGSHSSNTDKRNITYQSNGANPYLICSIAGRYAINATVIINNPTGGDINLQSIVKISTVTKDMNYISCTASGKWATVTIDTTSVAIPANGTIEFVVASGGAVSSLNIYDSFFNVQLINAD